MKYLTASQVAAKWNITQRRVQILCSEGRIEGVFKLGENCSLVLEATTAKYLEHTSSAVSWSIEVEDFDTICAELKKNGNTSGEEFIRFGRRTRRVCDPESNPFYITAKSN